MKKFKKRLGITLAIVAGIWTLLTFWAESKGKSKIWQLGESASVVKALVIYDPDPFYNLDEQVGRAFGEGLAKNGMRVTVATVAAAERLEDLSFDWYVFCANTYNWRPDWAVTGFIRSHPILKNRKVVAITLGAGSTKASQQAFENIIKNTGARLIGSATYWLLKPNDESRIKEKNVKVAVDMAGKWALQLSNTNNPK